MPPTSCHLHPLQVENCDTKSRLVLDEDHNGKFRLERLSTNYKKNTSSSLHQDSDDAWEVKQAVLAEKWRINDYLHNENRLNVESFCWTVLNPFCVIHRRLDSCCFPVWREIKINSHSLCITDRKEENKVIGLIQWWMQASGNWDW